MAAPRLILVLLTLLCSAGSGALQGRVLCLGAGDHVALEAPHGGSGCPAALADGHDEHSEEGAPAIEGDGAGGGCTDLTAGFSLTRGGRGEGIDFAPAAAPFMVAPEAANPVSSGSSGALALRHRDLQPAEGDLSRLRGIVLLI